MTTVEPDKAVEITVGRPGQLYVELHGYERAQVYSAKEYPGVEAVSTVQLSISNGGKLPAANVELVLTEDKVHILHLFVPDELRRMKVSQAIMDIIFGIAIAYKKDAVSALIGGFKTYEFFRSVGFTHDQVEYVTDPTRVVTEEAVALGAGNGETVVPSVDAMKNYPGIPLSECPIDRELYIINYTAEGELKKHEHG